MKKIILTTAKFIAKNGLKNLGSSISFCLIGTRLFETEKEREAIEKIIEQLRAKSVTTHFHSDVTDSESTAIKAIKSDFETLNRGGLLVITNSYNIEAISKFLHKKYGEMLIIKKEEASEKTDTGEETGTVKKNASTVPDGKGSNQQWAY